MAPKRRVPTAWKCPASKHNVLFATKSVINDRETGRPRGFGFVTFSSKGLDVAIQGMNDQKLDGRQITVNAAQCRGGGGDGGDCHGGVGRCFSLALWGCHQCLMVVVVAKAFRVKSDGRSESSDKGSDYEGHKDSCTDDDQPSSSMARQHKSRGAMRVNKIEGMDALLKTVD